MLFFFLVTLCVLGNFHTFLTSADFSTLTYRNIIKMSNTLDADQDRHYVSPDLCQIVLQALSADAKVTNSNFYQLPLILTALLPVACLSHGMCPYQVMMTLHFLNEVANDAESTQKSKIMS